MCTYSYVISENKLWLCPSFRLHKANYSLQFVRKKRAKFPIIRFWRIFYLRAFIHITHTWERKKAKLCMLYMCDELVLHLHPDLIDVYSIPSFYIGQKKQIFNILKLFCTLINRLFIYFIRISFFMTGSLKTRTYIRVIMYKYLHMCTIMHNEKNWRTVKKKWMNWKFITLVITKNSGIYCLHNVDFIIAHYLHSIHIC